MIIEKNMVFIKKYNSSSTTLILCSCFCCCLKSSPIETNAQYDVRVSRQRVSVIFIHMWIPFQYYGWLFIKKQKNNNNCIQYYNTRKNKKKKTKNKTKTKQKKKTKIKLVKQISVSFFTIIVERIIIVVFCKHAHTNTRMYTRNNKTDAPKRSVKELAHQK